MIALCIKKSKVSNGYQVWAKDMKQLFIAITMLAAGSTANAADVVCSFMSETQINTNGEWIKTKTDFMDLYDMFGDGLVLPLENSLLANLDSGIPFYAGSVDRGNVFLMGGDMGVEGKLISVEGNNITIYDGFCDVTFG